MALCLRQVVLNLKEPTVTCRMAAGPGVTAFGLKLNLRTGATVPLLGTGFSRQSSKGYTNWAPPAS